MSYFKVKCCSPDIMRLIFLVLSILLGCWGAVQLGYAGSLSLVKTKSIQSITLSMIGTSSVSVLASLTSKMRQSEVLTNGPMAYYAVLGSLAIILSVCLILILLEVIGKQKRSFYFRVLFWSLLVGFIMEFAAAVYSSIMAPFYALLFEAELAVSQDYINLLTIQVVKDYYNGVRNFYYFTQAQVIITWILILPSLGLMIHALIEEFVQAEIVEEPTKIVPERLPTQEKTKVVQKVQVESFGVESFGNNNKSQDIINLKK